MKKKFLLVIAAGLFAVATVLSFNVSSANGASDVSLDDIAIMAQAQNEASGGTVYHEHHYTGATYMTSTSYDKATGETTVKYYRVEGTYIEDPQTGQIIQDNRKETAYRTYTYKN